MLARTAARAAAVAQGIRANVVQGIRANACMLAYTACPPREAVRWLRCFFLRKRKREQLPEQRRWRRVFVLMLVSLHIPHVRHEKPCSGCAGSSCASANASASASASASKSTLKLPVVAAAAATTRWLQRFGWNSALPQIGANKCGGSTPLG